MNAFILKNNSRGKKKQTCFNKKIQLNFKWKNNSHLFISSLPYGKQKKNLESF